LRQFADAAVGLARGQAELRGELRTLVSTTAATQEGLQRRLDERLEAVSTRVADGLKGSAAATQQSLADLGQRLALIDAAQKNISELSTQVVGLQDILSNKQARGAFGEFRLSDLVSTYLAPSDYVEQATLGNGRRVDCLIRLPHPPGPIAVDAKFPLESYNALQTAPDAAARKSAGRAFIADVLGHVRDIAERYIVPGETTDSAIMFLPSEAVYAELFARFPDVVEKAYRGRVWIVSPTTLMATLNTVRAVLKDARMREQAGVIQREVMGLLDDVNRLRERVSKLQSHFANASKDVGDIAIAADKIVAKASRIERVDLDDAPAAGEAADARVHPAVAAEQRTLI
ncbi:MAG: DNA recombination protein RmuC, partial [Alphaproteobacteria bacterium]|nr:DNA recombination protein RmuC [Alphaproteobacteria bacterium]